MRIEMTFVANFADSTKTLCSYTFDDSDYKFSELVNTVSAVFGDSIEIRLAPAHLIKGEL